MTKGFSGERVEKGEWNVWNLQEAVLTGFEWI